MSKSPFNFWDSAFIGPLAVCVNQYLNFLISEQIILWTFLVSYFSFTHVSFQINFSMFLKLNSSFVNSDVNLS